ncbi:Oaf3p NDAI_0A01040 [Naumovozyma dairenensis CBS 421]|uniref:Oleate activated transcription factor 3 n=1 Tax=Naumovozyma dairenensis (strain ATCC 10597 / BCRC 20456 / CBS 421 / NBRC 0211 / NRRL Y-12639) TaxID=1071378 RepID=G0W374_NAUDC|nr:hypothetical protein NDAI_0A01040 [Naumovozyma dairenensis CBS 421]CCD22262.1 hypothetical protein NDAI_0A01040 [Naumovozyma dairenensis CBS 421]
MSKIPKSQMFNSSEMLNGDYNDDNNDNNNNNKNDAGSNNIINQNHTPNNQSYNNNNTPNQPSRKRHRSTVVCTNCKKRKSKCDRSRPCGTCKRLGDGNSCFYIPEVPKVKPSKSRKSSISNIPINPVSNNNSGDDSPITTVIPPQASYGTHLLSTPHSNFMPKRVKLLKPSDRHTLTRSPDMVTTTSMQLITPIHHQEPEYINLIPNGYYIETKRSAVTLFSMFTDSSMDHRDPYLKAMTIFRSIAIEKTMQKLKVKQSDITNPSLPVSFETLTAFDSAKEQERQKQKRLQNAQAEERPLSAQQQLDEETRNQLHTSTSFYKQHQMIHKAIFEKFAKYRRNDSTRFDNLETIAKKYIPPRDLFLNKILPFFESNILDMIPIFNMRILTNEFEILYNRIETESSISLKDFDHVVYCIILIISRLTQLSLEFSKISHDLNQDILNLDSTKYIAIVNQYLFQMKTLRKCTLLQLQCLILLRFYHWCAPEDGDGQEAQQNQVLMGTIIASCKEVGINWTCLLETEGRFFKISKATRPNLEIMDASEYERIFKLIWCYVLFWDRKMCLVNGQECLIGKSFPFNGNKIGLDSWFVKIVELDHLIMKINDLINDLPSHVDLVQVEVLKDELENGFKVLQKYLHDKNHLNFEFQWMLDLFSLAILHAKMIFYEYDLNFMKFHSSAQQLWDQLIYVAQRCYSIFYNENSNDILNPFTKFYTNRIVEIVANKLCVLLPSFILRVSRFKQLDHSSRNLMVKFLYGISSIYFNEFGFEYYRCFKKMFTAKLSYKLLNRPMDKDAWQIILEFLVYELEFNKEQYENDKDYSKRTTLSEMLPLVTKLVEEIKMKTSTSSDDRKRIIDVWDSSVYPIGQYDSAFKLNLHEDIIEHFLIDKYTQNFNIFASFYDDASSQLAQSTANVDEKLRTKLQPQGKADVNVQPIIAAELDTLPSSWSNLAWLNDDLHSPPQDLSQEINPTDGLVEIEPSNFGLLQEIFEPLDFISFF